MVLTSDDAGNKRIKVETERTLLISGVEDSTHAVVDFFSNSKKQLNICVDSTLPAADIEVPEYYQTLKKLKSSGIKIRYVTEITKDNIYYCKKIAEELAEVRHLEGVKTNFGVNESEYMAASFGSDNGKPLIQLIYSNISDIVSQQHYVFETLWNKAISAEQRINQIELGINSERIEIINGIGDTTNAILQLVENAKNRLDGCGDKDAAIRIFSFQPYKKALLDAKARGVKIRIITDITRDNMPYCKELQDLAYECRHLDDIKINSGISDNEFFASVFNGKANVPYPQVIYSNSKEVVAAQNYVFEALWQKAMPADERIRALEEGIEPEFVEVFMDETKATNLIIDFAKSVKQEAQIILPHPKTMARAEKLGVWDYLISAATNHGAEIRVISPMTEETSNLAKQIMDKAPNIKIISGPIAVSGLFVQDEKRYLRAEYKYFDSPLIDDVLSRVIYSNSLNGVRSFKSFFETLWKQSQLYEQLRIANEKLILHDKMQREFINIAAHELRTPIQPILTSAELFENQLNGENRIEVTREDIELIIRNAKRLERLSSDILTASRIESQSLILHKEAVDLREKISNVIADIKAYIKNNPQLQIIFEPAITEHEGSIIVEADRSKLFEVLSNLLRNAIKFTEKGTITVSLKKQQDGYAITSIKDTGKGIDPEIKPRLFEKFVTKGENEAGTGLGLFISKSIVEAHGGRIWAKNNEDGKGATFAFSLPIRI